MQQEWTDLEASILQIWMLPLLNFQCLRSNCWI